ncbi:MULTISPECIES: Flp1 family type IVb pilin [Paenibacillus]|uniref:Multidrug transporter n=1 Tax=Paenibacillus arenosi TaxID=2774142 RepID=A0ABR9B0X5_9BACL|nr:MULTISPECIES: Flp1 family type IVb pilin [Paenibacillus]MBD8500010.1 multidrug transporter [Paenibacillus arenosi]
MLQAMKFQWKRFWKEEDGLGMVELVVIIAVVVFLALIFRNQISSFISSIITGAQSKTTDLMGK